MLKNMKRERLLLSLFFFSLYIFPLILSAEIYREVLISAVLVLILFLFYKKDIKIPEINYLFFFF